MTNPLVSICMPVYNAENFLAEAIDSCLSQSYSNTEIICVNDGSADKSLEILKSFQAHIMVIDVLKQGAQVARNLAFERSHGEFINFFDADNKMLPEKIEMQLPPLLEDKADLVFAKRAIMTDDGKVSHPSALPSPEGMDPFCYCLKNNTPGGRAAIDTDVALHRREMISKINGFRPGVKRAQDKDLTFRLAAAGARFHYIDEFVTLYRDHEGPRISNIKKSAAFNVDYFVSLTDVLLSDDVYHLSQDAKKALARKLIKVAKCACRQGEQDAGNEGFVRALLLYPPGDEQEGALYKTVRKLLGYPLTESIVSKIVTR